MCYYYSRNIATRSSLKGPESAKSGHYLVKQTHTLTYQFYLFFYPLSLYKADFCLYVKLIDHAYEMAY